MKDLSKFQLSLLSLLVIVGFGFNAMVQHKIPYVIIGYVMMFIGGIAFGKLLRKEYTK
jgi:hypothetical protein